jgi:catechol 2,3-dioxygenase-like lactoylglutathione lyase family enzyme
MSVPKAVVSLVTLGVTDLARSIAFYERLGFRRRAASADGVGFFEAGAVALAVYPAADLANDAGLETGRATSAVSLAWNCASPDAVDTALALAAEAGAAIHKRGHTVSWAAISAISPIPTAISGKSRTIPAFRSAMTGGSPYRTERRTGFVPGVHSRR